MVAIIAAVALTLRRRRDVIYTSASQAVSVTKADRLRLIEMPADTAYARQDVKDTEGEPPTGETT
jgi:NADH-quinone oxidoreductase subunit J